MKANKNKSVDILIRDSVKNAPQNAKSKNSSSIGNLKKYELWKKTNVFKQKQNDFYGINIKDIVSIFFFFFALKNCTMK